MMSEPFDIVSMKDENGLYPEDISAIIAAADPGERERLTRVGKMVIEHSRYEDAWEWLLSVLTESNTGREATAGLFYGVSGTGKSTILRRFANRYGGPFPTAVGLERPVLRISTPANPTLPNLYQALLVGLDAEGLVNKDANDMRLSVLHQIEMQKVKMIIFDEFTHIVEDRSEKFVTKAVRALKELLSEKKCQVVFAGTEELFKIHTVYKQMRRRSGGDMPLLPFDWEDEDDQAEWIAIMDLIQGQLLLKVSPPLGGNLLALKMHQATDGVMDHVMKLLFRATSFAHRDRSDTIGLGHLAMAFERLRRGDERENPFGQPPQRQRRPKIGEDTELSNLSKRVDPRDVRDPFTKS